MHGKSYLLNYPYYWYGDHSGGATPGLVSIPEVKSSSDLDCTIVFLWELQDVAGHSSYYLFLLFILKFKDQN